MTARALQQQRQDDPMDHTQMYLNLLGKSPTQISEILGEPFAHYDYRGREIFLFEGTNETITCESEEGVITRVNQHEDRRSLTRITPGRSKLAFLRHGNCRHKASVIDMSAKSFAMQVVDKCLPEVGDFVTFCTSLKTHTMSRTFITLAGVVHRVTKDTGIVVILLQTPCETHSTRALHDYLTSRQALTSLGKHVDFEPVPRMSEDANEEPKIVKSDLCLLCQEGACGFKYPSYSGKNLPVHRGIHEPK